MEEAQTREGLYGFVGRDNDQRRVEPSERKTYEAKQLWQRHHEVVNLSVQGFKGVEIAKILNIDPQTVSNILNSKLPMEKVAELRQIRDGEVKVRMEQVRVLTDKALQTYNEILDNEAGEATLKERKDTADRILMDLSGLKVPTKIVAHGSMTILNADQIKAFNERGKAAMREAGLVVDVEAEETEEEKVEVLQD